MIAYCQGPVNLATELSTNPRVADGRTRENVESATSLVSKARDDITEVTVPTVAVTRSNLHDAGKWESKETLRDPGRPPVELALSTGAISHAPSIERRAESTPMEVSMPPVTVETKAEKVGLDPIDGSPLSGWGDTVRALIECTCACYI